MSLSSPSIFIYLLKIPATNFLSLVLILLSLLPFLSKKSNFNNLIIINFCLYIIFTISFFIILNNNLLESSRFLISVLVYYNFYNHAETMKIMAQSLGPMFLYENVKNVLFLKFLSIHYPKVRFVVFTVFTLNNCIQHYENFNVKSLELLKKMNFDVLTENNFDFIKTPVISAAGMKAGNPNVKNESNHMRVEENQKFAEMVYKIINYEEYDTDWFADDAYIDGVEVDRALPDGTIMDKDEKFFLYE